MAGNDSTTPTLVSHEQKLVNFAGRARLTGGMWTVQVEQAERIVGTRSDRLRAPAADVLHGLDARRVVPGPPEGLGAGANRVFPPQLARQLDRVRTRLRTERLAAAAELRRAGACQVDALVLARTP